MKHITTIILALFISFTSMSQSDSLKLKKAALYMDSLQAGTSITDLKQWMYSNLTAREFNEQFKPLMEFYLKKKYTEWLKANK